MSVDVFTYMTNMYAEYVKGQGRVIDERTRFIMEVYVPSFSVAALIGVTIYITIDAVQTIESGGEDDDVDVLFLYGFAAANMLVDIISSMMFYCRGKGVLKNPSLRFSVTMQDEEPTNNLNMISALTHVGGDTLRTLSVFIAAVVATTTTVSGALCDAWAAVVVSFTICIAVCPLIKEIYAAATR